MSARRTLETCRNVQKELGDCLEEVFSYYQLQEKEALLAINEFGFEHGSKIMKETCHSFRTILEAVERDEFLKLRFPDIRSEYLGDALCMLLYAEMFLQRTHPERYPKLCELSDLALKQYPDEEGELERHRQYRSRIEAEQGNYRSALLWLILAKTERLEGNGVPAEDSPISEDTIEQFLDMVCNTEPKISCQYYLMYYLLIMAEAANVGDPFADLMHRVLLKQERLCSISELKKELEAVEQDRQTQRKKRRNSRIPQVALVGYTNAGKSTVLNQMVEKYVGNGEKKVLQKDMLFATLETSVRTIETGDNKPFFLVDTVGFIHKLPHGLVKAFHSTLEEVQYADLLVQVVDFSDEQYRQQMDVTRETLEELGAGDIPMIYVYNKADKCGMEALPKVTDHQVYMSAVNGVGIPELAELIKSKIYADNVNATFLIPYNKGGIASYFMENATVL
jgi:GTP-binding protein EngB required for normal cell division